MDTPHCNYLAMLFKQFIFTNNWDSLGTFLCLADQSVSQVQTTHALDNRIGRKLDRYLVYELQHPLIIKDTKYFSWEKPNDRNN